MFSFPNLINHIPIIHIWHNLRVNTHSKGPKSSYNGLHEAGQYLPTYFSFERLTLYFVRNQPLGVIDYEYRSEPRWPVN
jgi:hypothetical protein